MFACYGLGWYCLFSCLMKDGSRQQTIITSPDSSGSPLLCIGNEDAAATADSGMHHDARRTCRLQKNNCMVGGIKKQSPDRFYFPSGLYNLQLGLAFHQSGNFNFRWEYLPFSYCSCSSHNHNGFSILLGIP